MQAPPKGLYVYVKARGEGLAVGVLRRALQRPWEPRGRALYESGVVVVTTTSNGSYAIFRGSPAEAVAAAIEHIRTIAAAE